MKIQKITKTLLCFSIAATFFSFSGCSSNNKNPDSTQKTYTYNMISSNPSNWNPAEFRMNNESLVIDLTSSALYDFALNSEKMDMKLFANLPQIFQKMLQRNMQETKFMKFLMMQALV